MKKWICALFLLFLIAPLISSALPPAPEGYVISHLESISNKSIIFRYNSLEVFDVSENKSDSNLRIALHFKNGTEINLVDEKVKDFYDPYNVNKSYIMNEIYSLKDSKTGVDVTSNEYNPFNKTLICGEKIAPSTFPCVVSKYEFPSALVYNKLKENGYFLEGSRISCNLDDQEIRFYSDDELVLKYTLSYYKGTNGIHHCDEGFLSHINWSIYLILIIILVVMFVITLIGLRRIKK
jgi:hypothetical protein